MKKTTYFYLLPELLIKSDISVNFDGDKTDLRLHCNENISLFTSDTEEKYNSITDKIDKFEIVKFEYTVYLSYDVSGYQYWHEKMEENNYLAITIAFNHLRFNLSELENLGIDILNAIEFAENIELECKEYLFE
jgi:hypothetical protein